MFVDGNWSTGMLNLQRYHARKHTTRTDGRTEHAPDIATQSSWSACDRPLIAPLEFRAGAKAVTAARVLRGSKQHRVLKRHSRARSRSASSQRPSHPSLTPAQRPSHTSALPLPGSEAGDSQAGGRRPAEPAAGVRPAAGAARWRRLRLPGRALRGRGGRQKK